MGLHWAVSYTLVAAVGFHLGGQLQFCGSSRIVLGGHLQFGETLLGFPPIFFIRNQDNKLIGP